MKKKGIIIAVIVFVLNLTGMLLLGIFGKGNEAGGSEVEVAAVDDVREEEQLADGNLVENNESESNAEGTKENANADQEDKKNKNDSDKGNSKTDSEYDTFEDEAKLLKFQKYVATPTEYISLRRKAGYGDDVITKIVPGTILEYLGQKRVLGDLFYKVRDTRSKRVGYVVSKYATPLSDTKHVEPKLSIVNAKDATYTYEDMKKDINQLCKKYPKYLKSEVLGKSLDGRNMYKLTLGDPEAKHHILIEAGIHARESMSSVLVMSLVEYYCSNAGSTSFQGKKYKEYLSDYSFDIVPMVNPDGVDLELLGLKGIHSGKFKKIIRECYNRDKKYLRQNSSGNWYDLRTTKGVNLQRELRRRHKVISMSQYFRIWKSNARGVDLNRNFDAEWKALKLKSKPSFEKYKGKSPESEPEAKVLADLLRNNEYEFQLSYHTSGQVIYYDVPGNTRLIRSQSINRAIWFRQFTGYTPVSEVSAAENGGIDLGGYADWVMSQENIPALCIELGLESSPVKSSEFRTIFFQNRETWMALCYYQNLIHKKH